MNNKTNIEEDIKILENFLQTMKSDFRTGLGYEDELQAIENILADIERVLEENEEYKKQLDLDYVKENYIRKLDVEKAMNEARQTINKANKYDALVENMKEKLNELIQKLKEANNDRWEKDDNAYYNKIKAQIRVLQELILEEE